MDTPKSVSAVKPDRNNGKAPLQNGALAEIHEGKLPFPAHGSACCCGGFPVQLSAYLRCSDRVPGFYAR